MYGLALAIAFLLQAVTPIPAKADTTKWCHEECTPFQNGHHSCRNVCHEEDD